MPSRSLAEKGGRRATIGRRLSLAFASLACVNALALLFVLSGLREVVPALEGIRQLEEKDRILLALEVAVREQYARDLLAGTGERLQAADYEEIRRYLRTLEDNIAERGGDPEAGGLAGDIARAAAELERLRRLRAAARTPTDLEALDDQAYAKILLIDERIDQLQARKDHATVRLREQVTALNRWTLGWTIAFLAGAPLLAVAVALAIRRSVARPLARLGEAALRLAGGDRNTRIEIRSRDELGLVAAQFNEMAEALVRRERELVESEKLAGIGRLAAGIAHELNNPLSAMIGYLMLHRRKAQGQLARDLATVEQEAHRCREIVGDLLELTRPPDSFARRRVDLRALCDEVVADLRVSGQVGDARLSVEGAGEALGNRTKLRQVVLNLVRNGAEAAGRGGRVRVRVESSPEAVELAVADDGPGIPPEVRTRIFEPFFTTKDGGTGLGLAVSRAIARAHGGDLAVRDGVAGGAVLAMRLPPADGRV